jgi:hypothetical protein
LVLQKGRQQVVASQMQLQARAQPRLGKRQERQQLETGPGMAWLLNSSRSLLVLLPKLQTGQLTAPPRRLAGKRLLLLPLEEQMDLQLQLVEELQLLPLAERTGLTLLRRCHLVLHVLHHHPDQSNSLTASC